MIEVDQETTPGKNNDSKNHAPHGSAALGRACPRL